MIRANKCKHYTGTVNKACAVGVEYATVELNKGTPGYSLPCITKYNAGGATCSKCEMPTAEEIVAEEVEHRKRMDSMMLARKAIVAHLGGPWKKGTPGASGVIDCPACNGVKTLRFSRAGYNGHVHAACLTAGCVQWME
jgi:hypothetical protein